MNAPFEVAQRGPAREFPPVRPGHRQPAGRAQVELAGVTADLVDKDEAIAIIIDRAGTAAVGLLGVVSMNLDHLHYFGSGRTSGRLEQHALLTASKAGRVEWLSLLGGEPLVRRASELTGRQWPRLIGRDMIEMILAEAERKRLRVGFLGESAHLHQQLRDVLSRRWPDLAVAGCWVPARAALDDHERAGQLAASVYKARVHILVISLAKPRQERWIAEHGPASGARVCLALGAVEDFLVRPADEPPPWVSSHGIEWTWRLAREPRRLAGRYLVQGSGAYRALRRESFVLRPAGPALVQEKPQRAIEEGRRHRFG